MVFAWRRELRSFLGLIALKFATASKFQNRLTPVDRSCDRDKLRILDWKAWKSQGLIKTMNIILLCLISSSKNMPNLWTQDQERTAQFNHNIVSVAPPEVTHPE